MRATFFFLVLWCLISIALGVTYNGTITADGNKWSGTLQPASGPADTLKLEASFVASDIFRVKLFHEKDFQVPPDLDHIPATVYGGSTSMSVEYEESPFELAVTRADSVLVELSDFEYSSAAITVTTALPANVVAVTAPALGAEPGKLFMKEGAQATLWTAGADKGFDGIPFVMVVTEDGSAYGLLWRSGSLMTIARAAGNKLSFTAKPGGIIDILTFAGPTPAAVLAQLTTILGRPAYPSRSAFGFHLEAVGFSNLTMIDDLASDLVAASVPVETLWVDLKYEDKCKTATQAVAFGNLTEFAKSQHERDISLAVAVRSGVSSDVATSPVEVFAVGTCHTFTQGACEVQLLDMMNPLARARLGDNVKALQASIGFDAVTLAFSRDSSFACKQNCTCAAGFPGAPWDAALGSLAVCSAGHTLAAPPPCAAAVNATGDAALTLALQTPLMADTVARAAHEAGMPARTLVVADRLAYAVGADAAVRLYPTSLAGMVAETLQAGLMGAPWTVASLCGTTNAMPEAECQKWIDTAVFAPMVMHQSSAQGASLATKYAAHLREALALRLQLLPYLMTHAFLETHALGVPLWMPVALEFPAQAASFVNSTQFMVGHDLLVSLDPQAALPTAPFHWIDLFPSIGVTAHTTAPRVSWRTGSILALHDVASQTPLPSMHARASGTADRNTYTLTVALPPKAEQDAAADEAVLASGSVFVELGDSTGRAPLEPQGLQGEHWALYRFELSKWHGEMCLESMLDPRFNATAAAQLSPAAIAVTSVRILNVDAAAVGSLFVNSGPLAAARYSIAGGVLTVTPTTPLAMTPAANHWEISWLPPSAPVPTPTKAPDTWWQTHPVLTVCLIASVVCVAGVFGFIAFKLCRRRKIMHHYSRVATEVEEGL